MVKIGTKHFYVIPIPNSIWHPPKIFMALKNRVSPLTTNGLFNEMIASFFSNKRKIQNCTFSLARDGYNYSTFLRVGRDGQRGNFGRSEI